MRKRAFLAGAILAAFALVVLVTANQVTAFNDQMDTLSGYPPTTWSAGGWTVTLLPGYPQQISSESGRYLWRYQVYKTGSSPQSAAGLIFVALLVPNCYNCGCGDFSPTCSNAITSWVAQTPKGKCLPPGFCDSNAQAFEKVFNVGVGESKFAFGHDILQGYIVKGWTSLDTDDSDCVSSPPGQVEWDLVTNTNFITTTTILLRTMGAGQIPMLIAGPGCAPAPKASAPSETFPTPTANFTVSIDPQTGCYVAASCSMPDGSTGTICSYPLSACLQMQGSSGLEPVYTLSSPGEACAYAEMSAIVEGSPQWAFVSNEPYPNTTAGTIYYCVTGSCGGCPW